MIARPFKVTVSSLLAFDPNEMSPDATAAAPLRPSPRAPTTPAGPWPELIVPMLQLPQSSGSGDFAFGGGSQ